MTTEDQDSVITATAKVSPDALARIEAHAKSVGMTAEEFIKERLAIEMNRRMVTWAEEWFSGVKAS